VLVSKYIYIHVEQRSPSAKRINTMVLGTLIYICIVRNKEERS